MSEFELEKSSKSTASIIKKSVRNSFLIVQIVKMSSSTDQKTTEIEKASAEPSVDT